MLFVDGVGNERVVLKLERYVKFGTVRDLVVVVERFLLLLMVRPRERATVFEAALGRRFADVVVRRFAEVGRFFADVVRRFAEVGRFFAEVVRRFAALGRFLADVELRRAFALVFVFFFIFFSSRTLKGELFHHL